MVLFVCTGNICRSPMAEHLLRHRLGRAARWETASAGIAAASGMPASWGAIAVMREVGLDVREHRSQPLTPAIMDAATMIVVMTTAHRELVRQQYPLATDRIHLLKSFDLTAAGWDVDDPIGLSLEVYRGIRDEIAKALPGLVAYLERHDVPESSREGGWAWPPDVGPAEDG
jgi:protein-tyrosine-phosphatase